MNVQQKAKAIVSKLFEHGGWDDSSGSPDSVREPFSRGVPNTWEEGIEWVKTLLQNDLMWHFDDGCEDTVIRGTNTPFFSPKECEIGEATVEKLNALCPEPDPQKLINFGAWDAYEKAKARLPDLQDTE